MSSLCKFAVTLFSLVILQTILCTPIVKGGTANEHLPIKKLNASERVKTSTKWCSPTIVNPAADKFGAALKTDKCCKTYVECSDLIAPGESKFGLINTGSLARPSCKCAGDFFECLNSVTGSWDDLDYSVAKEIGSKYFSTVGDPCYNLQKNNCPNGYYDAANNRYNSNEKGEKFCAEWMIIYWHDQRTKSYFQRYVPGSR